MYKMYLHFVFFSWGKYVQLVPKTN